jgi:uncharacterized damage-inducible protein DinB
LPCTPAPKNRPHQALEKKIFITAKKIKAMSTPTEALKAQFDMQTRLFSNVLDGITEAEAGTRENDHVNHMKYIAGHVLNTRLGAVANFTGQQPDNTYAAQFGRGVAIDPNASYPPLSEIAAKWKESAQKLSDGLANVPAEALASKSPAQFPIGDDTVQGALSFFLSHEAYHIGQLGLLRKMLGKGAMSYN